ncbi:MAG TPA: SIMPL domain-containing protein [Candidatus Limnocylindrales bacterium]|nr:SIMPL domain-containing protein [Candidatus Limnocylindrales bacterium]
MNTTIRALLVALGVGTLSAVSVIGEAQPKPTISVAGSAEIKVAPDEVHLRVGVESRYLTLDGAKQRNDERISRALLFLKQNGVKDQEVQTDYLIVEPIYSEHPEVDPTTGLPLTKVDEKKLVDPILYVVRKSIGVKLTQVSSFDKILSGLVTNGVNHVQRVDFRTSELGKLKDQARKMAIRSAKEKAQAMAAELGVKVGKPLYINVEDQSWWGGWSPPGNWSYGSGGGFGGGSPNAAQNPADEAGATFAVGQISVTARVTVSFLIQ